MTASWDMAHEGAIVAATPAGRGGIGRLLARLEPGYVSLAAIAVLATLVFESVLVLILWRNSLPLSMLVFGHFGYSLLLAGWALWFRAGGKLVRVNILLAITTPFMGPLAPLGLLLVLAVYVLSGGNGRAFEEWYAALFPDRDVDMMRQIYEDLVTGRADAGRMESVASFTDILHYGTFEQKQAVISLLARHYQPVFAPALRMALKDENPAIRVQAATAAAQVENDFLDRVMTLKERLARQPRNPEMLLKMAALHDEYAYSGLLDPEREKSNRKLAMEHYQRYLVQEPDDDGARATVGRLLLREGDIEEAARWLEAGLSRGRRSPQLMDWYMEALFLLGRYDKLRRFIAENLRNGEDLAGHPERIQEVIRYWSGEAGASASHPLEEGERAGSGAQGLAAGGTA